MIELKPLPCPFCGGINIINCGLHKYCHSCGAEGPDADNGTDAGLLSAWNRRAQPAQAGQVLTDEEIDAAWNECDWYETKRAYFDAGVHWAQKAVLAKRVPMTDAQIAEYQEDGVFWQSCKHIVRDIEKFHGIVGEKGVAT